MTGGRMPRRFRGETYLARYRKPPVRKAETYGATLRWHATHYSQRLRSPWFDNLTTQVYCAWNA
jgi:hypothetical protein